MPEVQGSMFQLPAAFLYGPEKLTVPDISFLTRRKLGPYPYHFACQSWLLVSGIDHPENSRDQKYMILS